MLIIYQSKNQSIMNGRQFLKEALLTLMCMMGALSVWAQQIAVKGVVRDAADNSPIPGVSVVVKNTTRGTITDFNGNFSVNANEGDVLVFSFIGYTNQELAAAANMQVSLVSDAQELDDVVVIGYGTTKKNDMTGSVTAIKPDEMNKGMITNAQDMISGKIAGVNVTSDGGTPGGGSTIRIRGGSSLNASNDPLIVIDGLAMDQSGVKGLANPLSMVNPADIETFTVLKDASATAIYGSRGSNGVIIITTKKGKANGGRPQISYNGNVSVSMIQNQLDLLDGDEYRAKIEELYGEGGMYYNEKTYAAIKANLGDANTDWQDEIFRVALSTDHNLTISGGVKDVPYRVGFGYTKQNGILDTSNFERYTVSLNVNPTFLDKHLSFNLAAKGMLAKSRFADTGAISAAYRMDPTQPVKTDDEKYKNFGGFFQWTVNGESLSDPNWAYNTNRNAPGNPVSYLEDKEDKATSKSFIGTLEGDYKIHGFEDLRLHGSIGIDASTGKQTTVVSPYSYLNTYFGWDGWDKIDKYNLSLNAYAQYSKDFTETQHFDVMAGYEWQHFHKVQEYDGWGLYQSTYVETVKDSEGKVVKDEAGNPVTQPSALAGTQYGRSAKTIKTENYLVSFFGRLNYSLLDRYLLTINVRDDGSSRFKDHWALFTSVALGWRVKQEAFLEDVEAISDMKVRLGYGQTGQQEGIGDYNYFASYNISSGVGSKYNLVGDGTMYRPDAYNENLKWETTTTYNAGLDLGFFNNRLTVNADFYYRETTDLLNTVSVAAGSNFRNKVTSNIGSLENKGFELGITGHPIHNDDWHWEVSANATYNKNEITELISNDEGYYVETGGISSGTGNYCQAHAVGHAANAFYVYQQVYGSDGKPLEGVFVDRNGDGQITSDDRYFYKQPTAPWTFGFSSKLQWKNVDFGFSLRASIGNYVYNDREAGSSDLSQSTGLWNSSFEYLSNRPKYAFERNWGALSNYSALSDYFVQNASFLKCDNITLGYSFKNIASAPLSGRVYGSVSNVFTITDYKGIDPEVFGGIDNTIYPRPITFLVGLSLNF